MTLEHEAAGAVERPPLSPIETSDLMHTPQIGEALENAEINCARGLPGLKLGGRNSSTLAIVGGGPSLKDTIDQIRQRRFDCEARIIAINDAYDYLMEHGICPDYFAMCEIAPWPKEFLTHANRNTVFYMCDIAHPSAFDRLIGHGYDVRLWHLSASDGDGDFKPRYEAIVEKHYPGAYYLGGGEAMSLKAINLGMARGFRDFEMYGIDGCYRSGSPSHAYMDRKNGGLMQARCAGRDFLSAYYLARQADDLRRMCEAWGHTFRLRCYGDGLVQHMHRTGWPQMYE